MQVNGIRPDQVTQVRGFADQRLRKIDAPMDPINRRVPLIVQYLVKPYGNDDDPKPPGAGGNAPENKMPGAGPAAAPAAASNTPPPAK